MMETVDVRELLSADPFDTRTGRTLLREAVYERVLRHIVDGTLPPETKVRDADIAEALGVSRTPVREALKRLEDEGFVVAAANRWTKVTGVDPRTADDLYPIVWALERLAATMSPPWTAEQVDGLREANDRLAVAIDAEDAVGARDADNDFHRRIVEASGNAEIAAITGQLKVRLHRIEVAYFGGQLAGRQSVSEHEQVIQAFAAGDQERAGLAVEQNWRGSLERLHARLEDEGN
jgi:DNA-binding GntR family transcriptional regulator